MGFPKMVVADALMPIDSFLPVPIGADNRPGMEYRYLPARSREPVVFEVCSPAQSSFVYGSDGQEVITPKRGQFIDCYI
jgi:hypothetical protein